MGANLSWIHSYNMDVEGEENLHWLSASLVHVINIDESDHIFGILTNV